MSNWQQSENTKTNTITKGTPELYPLNNPYELLEKAIKEIEERIKKLEEKQNYDLKQGETNDFRPCNKNNTI